MSALFALSIPFVFIALAVVFVPIIMGMVKEYRNLDADSLEESPAANLVTAEVVDLAPTDQTAIIRPAA